MCLLIVNFSKTKFYNECFTHMNTLNKSNKYFK